LNKDIYEQFRDRSSSVKFDKSYWESDIEKNIGDSTLFTIAGNSFSVNDFVELANEETLYAKTRMTNGNIEKAVNDIVAKNLLIEKAFKLKEGNTEFAKLMDDYKNGLYIFKLQEEEIWEKIEVDTTQLPALYEETKENYVWPDRAAFDVIYRTDSASIYSDKKLLDSGTPFETILLTNKKDLKLNNKNKRHVLRAIEGDAVAEKAFSLDKPGDISEPFKIGNGWYIVQLTEKEPSRLKTYEEAQPEVIGIWQERQSKKLEEKYIQRLRKLYEPELYYDRLAEIQNN
jgi:peptidyl-prolyl cis-trans isomerase SurA